MSNYNGTFTPSKDASAIQLENVDGQAGSNTNINSLADNTQSPRASISSAGNSAGSPVKQVQVITSGIHFQNPA